MNKSYCEVIVDGSFDLIRGFVLGFLEGKGLSGEAIFENEHHIQNENTFGQLLRFIGVKEEYIHCIVGCGFHNLLRQAVQNRGLQNEIKLISVRDIRDAYFEFNYRAYNRKLGEKFKVLFGSLPAGLRIEKGRGPEEQVHPDAKGIEAYAPLHEYELKGSGEIHGPVKEIIDFYGMLEHEEMIELGHIKLIYCD